jgi:hypothetical protein
VLLHLVRQQKVLKLPGELRDLLAQGPKGLAPILVASDDEIHLGLCPARNQAEQISRDLTLSPDYLVDEEHTRKRFELRKVNDFLILVDDLRLDEDRFGFSLDRLHKLECQTFWRTLFRDDHLFYLAHVCIFPSNHTFKCSLEQKTNGLVT